MVKKIRTMISGETYIYICIPFILFLLCKTYQYFKFQILRLLELQRNKYKYFDPLHRVPTNSGYQFMFYSLENVIIYTFIVSQQNHSLPNYIYNSVTCFQGIQIFIFISPFSLLSRSKHIKSNGIPYKAAFLSN